MIEKSRLEELIEKNQPIYYGKSRILKPNIWEKGYIISDKTVYEFVDNSPEHQYLLKSLFETKEERNWYYEFGNIERIEKLTLPTWEEIQKIERFDFNAKDGHRYTLHYLEGCKTLAIVGIIENKFYGNATKENYLEACRLAKKLFLGERI